MNSPGTSSGSRKSSDKRRRNSTWKPYYHPNGNKPPQNPAVLSIPVQLNAGSVASPALIQEPASAFFLDTSASSYPGWQLYFPTETYNADSPIVRKADSLKAHFKKNSQQYDLAKIRRQFWFPMQLQTLSDDSEFERQWPSFQQDLVENPDTTIACAGLAMHKLVSETVSTIENSQSVNFNTSLQTIRPRIFGHGPILNLRFLKVNNYDRLVTIRGTVLRVGAPEIICTWMAFSCPNCSTEQVVRQIDGVFSYPRSCKGGCRTRNNFTVLLSSSYTRTEPFQTIRIQETMMGMQYDGGRVPRSIEAELTEDLVDSVLAGDDITLTGILKVRSQQELQRKCQASLYKIYIRAVSTFSNKSSISNRMSEFTENDIESIKLMSKEPYLFRLIVHSLSPKIYGHEMIKAGLVLGLFGGCSSEPGKRTEIHVLVVGDPGVGKSQMLQACANVSPRGIFVCGNSSSTVGLTASVRHEKGGGSLEAGALVLADQGVCCIDEFDKMTSNHQPLLEVMEQQTVSVAKAGVICSLPARTCILAAANPSGGHYDRSKTVAENLKINPALLSRFDLVFIQLDRADAHLDSLLTAHIQALHYGEKQNLAESSTDNSFVMSSDLLGVSTHSAEKSLAERLRLLPNERIDSVSQIILQKYIAYARKNINPKITPEAGQELKKFYLEMRRVRQGMDTIPVTTRQLEGLIRLTQARARLELASQATLRHVMDVLAIVRYSLVDVFSTDTGSLHIQRNINGSGMSQISQVKKFLQLLTNRSSTLNKTVFELSELNEIAIQGAISTNFTNILDSLNVQGFLLKKGQNMYKFVGH